MHYYALYEERAPTPRPAAWHVEVGSRPGAPEYAVNFRGTQFWFAGEETKAAFVASGGEAAPMFGGWCVYGLAFERADTEVDWNATEEGRNDPRVNTLFSYTWPWAGPEEEGVRSCADAAYAALVATTPDSQQPRCSGVTFLGPPAGPIDGWSVVSVDARRLVEPNATMPGLVFNIWDSYRTGFEARVEPYLRWAGERWRRWFGRINGGPFNAECVGSGPFKDLCMTSTSAFLGYGAGPVCANATWPTSVDLDLDDTGDGAWLTATLEQRVPTTEAPETSSGTAAAAYDIIALVAFLLCTT
jgi:hypothetical protein